MSTKVTQRYELNPQSLPNKRSLQNLIPSLIWQEFEGLRCEVKENK